MFQVLTSATDTAMDNVTTGATQAVTFMSSMWTAMTGNPYLAVFLGVTMLGAGVVLFRKLRRGA